MFTPMRLDRALALPEAGREHAPFLDRASASSENARERIALAAYCLARLVDRFIACDGTEAAERELRYQRDMARDYIASQPLADPDGLRPVEPELELIARVVGAAGVPPGSRRTDAIRDTLADYAAFLEGESRWLEALDTLRLGLRTWQEPIPASCFCPVALAAGRINLQLNRPDQAASSFAAAAEAAVEAQDQSALLRARIGAAAIVRLRGNLAAARAEVEEIIRETSGRPALEPVAGMAYSELGELFASAGRPIEGLRALYEAFSRSSDPAEQAARLTALGEGLAALGECGAAESAFELALHARPGRAMQFRIRLDLMDLASAQGNRLGFERHRAIAGAARAGGSAESGLDFDHRTAIGLARFGQFSHAVGIWREALARATAGALPEWQQTIGRMLAHLDECRAQGVVPAPKQPPMPDLAVLSADLRHLAARAGA